MERTPTKKGSIRPKIPDWRRERGKWIVCSLSPNQGKPKLFTSEKNTSLMMIYLALENLEILIDTGRYTLSLTYLPFNVSRRDAGHRQLTVEADYKKCDITER